MRGQQKRGTGGKGRIGESPAIWWVWVADGGGARAVGPCKPAPYFTTSPATTSLPLLLASKAPNVCPLVDRQYWQRIHCFLEQCSTVTNPHPHRHAFLVPPTAPPPSQGTLPSHLAALGTQEARWLSLDWGQRRLGSPDLWQPSPGFGARYLRCWDTLALQFHRYPAEPCHTKELTCHLPGGTSTNQCIEVSPRRGTCKHPRIPVIASHPARWFKASLYRG
jgi:hypothetical protein